MAINRVAPRIRTAMSTAAPAVALRASYVNAALELQRARIGRMRQHQHAGSRRAAGAVHDEFAADDLQVGKLRPSA